MIHWTNDKIAQILLIGFTSVLIGKVVASIGLVNEIYICVFLWIAGSLYYIGRAAQKINSTGKAVLITGCDTGIGNELALHLDRLGFRVFAACLFAENGEGAKKLRESGSDKLHVLQLDVTNESEIQSSRETVEKLLSKDECLWGVVNNAGISNFGNVEWVPVSMFKKLADVNVFGMVGVIKGFLPLLRKSKGRIVNTASSLGRFAANMRSTYVATKYAVEGLSDSLRSEMRPLGIDVCIIEPSNFVAATGIFTIESVEKQAEEMWKNMTEETKQLCGEKNFRNSVEVMKGFSTAGHKSITPVIIAMEEALTQKYPQVRYQVMEAAYKLRTFVATHFPEWIYDICYGTYLEK